MSEINSRWYGVLTAENIEGVAAQVREILKGRFCIAEASYCDSGNADLRLISADCVIDSRWTFAPETEPVRVFQLEDGRKWFGFSAGHYVWSFNARADNKQDHEDYRYSYFVFEHDKFTVTDRAPAGKGYLHKRSFGAHRAVNSHQALIDEVKELRRQLQHFAPLVFNKNVIPHLPGNLEEETKEWLKGMRTENVLALAEKET